MTLATVAAQAICAYLAHRVAPAWSARATSAVDVGFTGIDSHVAARWRCASRFRTDPSTAVLIGAATRANRARLTVGASAVDVRLASVAKGVAA
jgi:hypothetical protein